MSITVHDTEEERLSALLEYRILNTPEETQFSSVAWLAAYICKTPVSLISFIDKDRQWIKARIGTDITEVPRDISLCNYTLQTDDILEVEDLSQDSRFSDNPAVKGIEHARFYAGVPLINPDGFKIGTICVVDSEPKSLDEQQKQALKILAKEVLVNLETRKNTFILEDLLEKAQKFHNLFNNSSELHCITDSEGKIAFVNTSVSDLLGYTPEEVIGKNIWEFSVPGERDRLMPDVYAAIAKGENRFHIETLIVTKDGSLKWFEWADVIMDGYWLVNGRDITERKLYESRLKNLTVAVEKSPAGVLIRGDKNEILWMNEAAENLIDYKLEELEGKEFGNLLVGPLTDIALLDQAKQLLTEKKPYEIEVILYKKGNVPVWLLLRNNPLFDKDGKLQSQITIALDITEKKKAESQLIKARQDAIDLSKSKELFLSVMSHEMRTPLNAVIGMTRILKAEDPLERQLENLEILEFSAANLLTLINDVLDYTKIETGNLQLEEVSLNIGELMSKTIESLKFKTEERAIDLLFSLHPQIPAEVLGDPTRLYQIFMNLLGNAVKFTHEGHVKLSADLLSDKKDTVLVRFNVEDTGIGIAKEKLASIFDAYSQAESNIARKYGGTGLGLSITSKLIDLHGSKISVDSEVGKGTRFIFDIEFKKCQANKAKATNDVVEEPLNAKILVVDDNAINRLLARKVLEKWSVICDFAENGQQAVDKIRSQHFDLVLMDIHMPVMGGEEATKAIRQLGDNYLNLPILALTGSALKDDESRFIDAGMNDFVLKPFEPKLLYQSIRKFLNKN